MAEPSIQDKREILIAWLESQGATDAKNQVMSWDDKVVNARYTAVMANRESSLATGGTGSSSPVSRPGYDNKLAAYLKAKSEVQPTNKLKVYTDYKLANPTTITPNRVQQYVTDKTRAGQAVSRLAELEGARATASAGRNAYQNPGWDTDTAETVRRSTSTQGHQISSVKPPDPCANLKGAAKASCYLQQKQAAMIAGEDDVAAFYDNLYINALAQYDLERTESDSEFKRTQEKQRILENMQSLKMQGVNIATGAMESALNNQRQYLNEGIVMAPGQQYLKGQEPGGELSQIMSRFGVPFQATPMPTIQVNPFSAAQYAQAGVGQALGNTGNYWGGLQESTAIPPDQIMSLVQKYFPPEEWERAYYVINRESGYNPNALNNTIGQQVPEGYSPEYSVGLFQINMAAHPQWQDRNLFDPEENIKTAAELWQSSGWQPWTTARDAGFLGTTPL